MTPMCAMRTMLACWLSIGACVQAQPLQLPPPPKVAFAPVPGAQLPLGARLTDDDGTPIQLGALFGRAPVVLVPGYYTCPNLCSTLFEGVLQALALSGLRRGEYQLVGLSIDPADTPAAATAKKRDYGAILPGGAQDIHLLTGSTQPIGALATALGYRSVRDRDTGQLAHAAGFVVAGADGRIVRYFGGVRFDPAALREAVRSAGRDEAPGWGQQLLLLCAHYAPTSGRHTAAAMAAVRAVALAVLALLLGWAWRRHRRGAG
jgi:protein SCO1